MDLAGEMLERAARATPAAVEDRGSGWWFRHTDGNAWWSGAVLAHDASDEGRLAERIEAAECFYAERDAAARFQVCPGCPPDLDRALADRGYRWEAPISLLTRDVAEPVEVRPAPGLDACVSSGPDPGWLAVLAATGGPRTVVENETRLLDRVGLPSAYVTVLADDEPVAIGRAVGDDGWTGVFTMATAPRARRRGAARLVLAAVTRWASEQGAPRLYLQVERSNTAACRLYAAAGFTEVATYHYRVRDGHAPR
ncbi:MAG: GNAT family N-acetyltransferase [Actinomycetes bacterium]